jgi:hypothetical protein
MQLLVMKLLVMQLLVMQLLIMQLLVMQLLIMQLLIMQLLIMQLLVMQLLVMQLSSASCHFIPLLSKYSHQNPVLNNLCASLNVRDQVSHQYRTISKITVLCIPLFPF